jgi:hypothetical protein
MEGMMISLGAVLIFALALLAPVPDAGAEESTRVCDESVIDYSDSKYPKTICQKADVAAVPARDLAPVTYTIAVCVSETVDYADSKYPKRTCLEKGMVERTSPPGYRVEVFQPWDYRHESGRYEFLPTSHSE